MLGGDELQLLIETLTTVPGPTLSLGLVGFGLMPSGIHSETGPRRLGWLSGALGPFGLALMLAGVRLTW